jgi:hypothetical protein
LNSGIKHVAPMQAAARSALDLPWTKGRHLGGNSLEFAAELAHLAIFLREVSSRQFRLGDNLPMWAI